MNHPEAISSFADVIDLWPSAEALAGDIGVRPGLPPVWKHRRAIPSKHWLAVAEAAAQRGIAGVTVDALAALAADTRTGARPRERARRFAPETALRTTPPFENILIANRGEIACRIIATARRLGIRTVAVYSEADASARHVDLADEAVAIGPAPAAESYLVADRILEAARQTGAQALHPGYGFLSENADFVRAVETAGIAFVGPGADAIAAMGDKIESKRLAKKAGVDTIPGSEGAIADAEAAQHAARAIGYPVMIKASAGGGGKGLRVAATDAEVREGFERAVSEARSSFGDDRVLIEKFIERPRHIEIQVFADSHGNTVYLGERECSVQRRHQKVVEEAPSPFVDGGLRCAMGEQAVALARAVGYRSAGTVEFVVGPDRDFYFLEMNTRLQVEHPVTEMVTGLDLVELMFRVAAGERLPFTQDDVRLDGWAIESRIYAEDARRGFVPSTGRLVRYRTPEPDENLRIDSGVTEGDEVSRFYDPMIAKLVTCGATREQAIAGQADALDRFHIRGPAHNVGFLAAIMANARFRAGNMTTGFIAEEWPDGFHAAVPAPEAQARFAAVATLIHFGIRARERALGAGADAALAGDGTAGPADWVAAVDGTPLDIAVRATEGGIETKVLGQTIAVRGTWKPSHHLFEGTINGGDATFQVERLAEGYRLEAGGVHLDIVVRERRVAALASLMPVKMPPDTSKFLLSPMPGLIVAVNVAEGDSVDAGEALAVVDAMKMENVFTAERDGKVARVRVAAGDSVAVDDVLIEFE